MVDVADWAEPWMPVPARATSFRLLEGPVPPEENLAFKFCVDDIAAYYWDC